MPAAPRVQPAQFRTIAVVTLVALAVIVVTGGAVRLTGSGLGCSDWPTCEPGQLTPRDPSNVHAMVEFVNRLFTGVVSLSVAATIVAAWWRQPRRMDLVWLSAGLVAGVIGQIVLGGLTVLFELAPPLVMGHFIVSMLLLWDGLVLVHRAGDERRATSTSRAVSVRTRRLAGTVLPALAGLVVVAGTVVTAAGPHAGDERAQRLDLAVWSATRFHSGTAWLLVLGVLVVLRCLHTDGIALDDRPGRAAELLVVITVAQGAIGYIQYFAGVPPLLVGAHLAGSCMVWLAAVHLALTVRDAPMQGSDPAVAPASSDRPTPYHPVP